MKKTVIFLLSFFFLPLIASAEKPYISVTPEKIIQGEPIMIQVEETPDGINNVAKIMLNGKSLWFYTHNNKPTALYGIDLSQKAGDYKISVKMENGEILEKTITIGERKKVEAPLGIPEKLGGNTPKAADNLVSNLTKENLVINNVKTILKKLWFTNFIYPIAKPMVTDEYGYLRKTGYYSIPHKGTDFHANEGTPVLAINRGIVRLARTFQIYGKTVAIDHGLGIVSYYMHLSKINVKEGELISNGYVIGLSGMTGYAEMPHLHLSVKINNISIDPQKFLDLFNPKN